jgi:hypothetical protein
MFAAAIANYISNKDQIIATGQPIINYTLAALTLPVLMAFAILGVEFNHFLTESIICVILVLVLANSIK